MAIISPGDQAYPGDYTWKETPVPIPNTAVKLPGPMVVAAAARVGSCRDLLAQAR